ncbi:hypothetical protein VXN63_02820 [Marinilactibacillus sp. XAAS-LB27]|uniref:hypothetical protein n=1 Tax=Marinilactibacillus sp. XAAS-LB27 TaxID=3114538 RepID=UPI002E196083|nr:hypothetical protein [Marinilactibacillus sp. XAAS-LB27]
MKIISTFQLEEDVSKKINDLEIENQLIKKHLTVYTKEEQVQSLSEELEVKVEGIDENEVSVANASDAYELNDSDATLFADTIQRGGYVILQDDSNKKTKSHNDKKEPAREDEDEKGDFEKAIDDHLSAPGFGVDFKEPGTDAETHEDNFNPDNHSQDLKPEN